MNIAKAIVCFVFLITMLSQFQSCSHQTGRQQWTEEEAWEWEKKVGVIKGFNSPVPAYPGMKREDILRKASELGFNSVRYYLSGEPDKHIDRLGIVLDEAEKYGLTVSPVIGIKYDFWPRPDRKAAIEESKIYTQNLIGEFRDDPRIVFWDLWNEPAHYLNRTEQEEKEELEWTQKSFYWAREVSPTQPLTASIFFIYKVHFSEDFICQKRKEVQAESDIHNFHLYDLSRNEMQAIDAMVKWLRKIGDRPLVCTEIIARNRGGTWPRSLSAFSKYNIHFYSWGMYVCDANWHVPWVLSSYEPYEPWFHDLLHPDGTPYDWQELEWIRNFDFAEPGEETDPGAEITERWPKWRAWKWMATGPVKGLYYTPEGIGNLAISRWNQEISEAESMGYNSLRVNLEFDEWQSNTSWFFNKIDTLLYFANDNNMRVMPALLTDADAENAEAELSDYVRSVVRRYGSDPRIYSWELYTNPGELGVNKDKITSILRSIFEAARFEFPNQPLTATPQVRVKDFKPDFDYRNALVHGRGRNGWNMLDYEGSSNPALVNYIWSLSDIISFESDMNKPETGWLVSVARRYGRPMICTKWDAPDSMAFKETLENFSKNHVYWYNAGNITDKSLIKSFRFIQIATPTGYTEWLRRD